MAEGGLANIGGRGSRRGPARVRGRDGGQHFAGAPVCLVETRGAGACERAAQLGSERHLASEHERGRDGPMPGGRRVDHGGGLRGLPEAGVGTVASAGAGSSDGQPFFSQRFLGTRAHRRERLRAHVSATLFARSQSHRGSVRQAQGAAAESRGTYPRGAHRGDGPSSRGGDGERCSRLLQAPRLPREGPSAMTDAIVPRVPKLASFTRFRRLLRIKVRAYWGFSYSLSRLDFSHLRAKGLEIRSSSLPYASSADQGAYPPPPTEHNDAVYRPSPPLSKSTPLPIPPALLSVGRVFAGRCGRPRCKKSQGPS